jgi:heat shock protein HtpX
MMAAGVQVPWLAILLLVFAPTIGGLLQLALSRAREYDADLDAAGLTGDPEGLASALMTLERRQGRLWEGLFLPGSRLPDPSLLRTHPRTEDRVERLLRLKPQARPVIDMPATRHEPGRSIVPPIRAPRIHWGRMGTWY